MYLDFKNLVYNADTTMAQSGHMAVMRQESFIRSVIYPIMKETVYYGPIPSYYALIYLL